MIYALNWTIAVRTLVSAVFLLVCVFLVIQGEGSIASVLAARYIVPTAIVIFLVLLNIPAVFGIAHKITFAKYWLFPNLNGEWEAVIVSNWPVIKKTYDAAKSGGPPFNAITDKLNAAEEKSRKSKADVVISSSLFSFKMVLRPVGSLRESRTLFMRPTRLGDGLSELSYVFEQVDTEAVETTDSKKHLGAGVVRFDPDTDEIRGDYWSDRREDVGLNTAGTIRMTRKRPSS